MKVYFKVFEVSLQKISWPKGIKRVVHVCPNMGQKKEARSSAAYCPSYCVILTKTKQILKLNLALLLRGHKSDLL